MVSTYNIELTLAKLSSTFTVKDIMIDKSKLIRADDVQEAQDRLSNYPEFDIIPMPSTGKIKCYLRRDRAKPKKIGFQDLISDSTSLIVLPDLLLNRDFFFVLSSSNISGFIHFSDLNNRLVKLPFFVLFEAVENLIWSRISNRLTDTIIENVLDEERVKELKIRMNSAKKKAVDLGWAGLLSFDEMLRFYSYFGYEHISNKERESLANIRNKVAHSDKQLIEGPRDIRKLTIVRRISLRILNVVI